MRAHIVIEDDDGTMIVKTGVISSYSSTIEPIEIPTAGRYQDYAPGPSLDLTVTFARASMRDVYLPPREVTA